MVSFLANGSAQDFPDPVFRKPVFTDRLVDFAKALPISGGWLACTMAVKIGHDRVHFAAPWNIAETGEAWEGF